MTNYIYEYYQKINDGTIIVGKWVRLVYDIVINDIDAGRSFNWGKPSKDYAKEPLI